MAQKFYDCPIGSTALTYQSKSKSRTNVYIFKEMKITLKKTLIYKAFYQLYEMYNGIVFDNDVEKKKMDFGLRQLVYITT